MDAPVAVDHLGDAEIHRDGHQRDRLVLAQSLGGHQERPHLAERILEGEVDRGFLVDVGLRLRAELFEIVGETEAVQHPLVLGFQERRGKPGERTRKRVLLVQDELERAGQRAFDGGAAQFGVALGGM